MAYWLTGENGIAVMFAGKVTVNWWHPGSTDLFTSEFFQEPKDLPAGPIYDVSDTIKLPADLPAGEYTSSVAIVIEAEEFLVIARRIIGLWLCVVFLSATQARAEEGTTKSFTYKKTKQADLEIVVRFPPGWKDTDKRPGVVFLFGGRWTSGRITQFEPQAIHLASRGMVAAGADCRVTSRHGVTPKECVEDAKIADRMAAMGDEFMKKSKELGHWAELPAAEGQPHGFLDRPPWQERTTQRMDGFLVSIGYLPSSKRST